MDGDRKRLIFVITQPVVGGAQKYVFDLAKDFNQNYQVSVACGGDKNGDLFQKLGKEKITAHHLKFLGREIKPGDDVLAFFEILKLFKSERPDIIHLNSSKAGLLGSLAAFFYQLSAKNYKPKIVFTAHGWIFKEDLSKWKKRAVVFLAWFSAKFQDKIICVSQNDFDQALKYKVAAARKLQVVHNGAGEVKFLTKKKARDEVSKLISREISVNDFLIVNFGRLYANKGLSYLIQAVQETRNKYQNLILVIFGDGPEREALQLLITNYQLQNTVFLAGDMPEVSKYLKAFDALVLSSTKEGFPYSILEAGLAGVPVVATDVGGVGEMVVNNQTGFLVEPKDSNALAKAVENIMANPNQAKKMAADLKKTVSQKFSFKDMVSKTEWVYKV
ncbi:MAG: glycosyltransferase family 4 protein [Parcubacteria group bacterium]|nr:glycosyltransferase family 4 protein [Parcubacteria group bacterium]